MKYALLTLQLFILFISPRLLALDTLHMAILAPTDSQIFRAAQAINDAISDEVGLPIQLHSMPGERALAELIKGDKIQADMARMLDLPATKDMLVSKTPIISMPFYVYAPSTLNIHIDGWSGLKKYRISYPRDWQYVRQNTQKFHKVFPVTTISQAINMVSHDRADLLISSPLAINSFLQSSQAQKVGLAPLQPALGSVELYTYFNKNYPDLSEQYETALLKLKRSGDFLRLIKETP